MKTTIKLLAIFALVLVAFSPNPAGAAANAYKYKGQGMRAWFYIEESPGCVYTSVSIFVAEDMFKEEPGKGSKSSQLLVGIDKYDWCSAPGNYLVFLASGEGPLSPSDFRIAGDLDSATLTTTINVYDYASESYYDIFIDLKWTGEGGIWRDDSHYNRWWGDCHMNIHNNSVVRYSQVSGTVSNGTTNFTTEPSIDGQIFSAKDGSVYHHCE